MNEELTVALLVIVLSRKCSFSSPSDYYIATFFSVALLAIILDFLH